YVDLCSLPTRRSSDLGGNRGIRTCFGLCILQILQPFCEEAGNIHVVGGCAEEDLRIAQPAEALITLGAVRGNVYKVALLPPNDRSEEHTSELQSRENL